MILASVLGVRYALGSMTKKLPLDALRIASGTLSLAKCPTNTEVDVVVGIRDEVVERLSESLGVLRGPLDS